MLDGQPCLPLISQPFSGGPPTNLNIGIETGRNIDLPSSIGGRAAASAGALIYRTFKPRYEGGLLGPHWLILLPIAALVSGLRPRLKGPLWTATLVGVLCWGFLVQYARFLLPVLVGAAALAGSVPPALGKNVSRLTRWALTGLLLAIFGWNTSVLLSNLNIDRLATVAGLLGEEDFRIRWVDVAPASDFISANLQPEAIVLMVAEARSFGLERMVIVEDPYRTPFLVEMAEAARSPADLAKSLRDLGVTHILVNEGEMDRMARIRRVDDYWTPASDRSRDLIQTFLATEMTRVFEIRRLWIGEIKGPASAPDRGPPRTAS